MGLSNGSVLWACLVGLSLVLERVLVRRSSNSFQGFGLKDLFEVPLGVLVTPLFLAPLLPPPFKHLFQAEPSDDVAGAARST